MEKIKLKFIKEVFRKTNWALLACQNNDDKSMPVNIKINGECKRGDLEYGRDYVFFGERTSHPKYGRGFKFTSYCEIEPLDIRSISKYIVKHSTGLGIGKTRADAICKQHGTKSLEVIRENPELVDVSGVSELAIKELSLRLNEVVISEDTTAKLLELLDGRGFSKNLISNLWERFGANAYREITENPYVLLTFKGCGFNGVDRLYLDLGGDPNGLWRQAWTARFYALQNGGDGSTWQPRKILTEAIRKNIPDPDVNEALIFATDNDILAADWNRENFALPQNAANEMYIAMHIADSIHEPCEWPKIDDPVFKMAGLTKHQTEEIEKSLSGVIACFHGRAGTGKTHSITPIIRWAIDKYGKNRIKAVAPTGKAAVRINEVLSANMIDLKATTIHGVLEPMSDSKKGWRFKRNEDNPIDADLIIVDEDSMIDLFVMKSLLKARKYGCHVLFIGDPMNQLPPVGNGAAARDMMQVLPCGNLTKIVRNSGDAVRHCHSICDGEMPKFASKFDFSKGTNVIAKECSSNQITNYITSLYGWLQDNPPIDPTTGFQIDPIMEVQVIVATNALRRQLNNELQSKLNGDEARHKYTPFRKNDKVVCTKNSEYKIHRRKGSHGIKNGDFGKVLEVTKDTIVVHFSYPRRVVEVPIFSDSETSCNLDLAYAATCHKMQGSSAKIIIVACEKSFAANLVSDRNWWNTAISRLTLCGYVVGDLSAMRQQIKTSKIMTRKTFLGELISDSIEQSEIDEAEYSTGF